MKDTKDKKRPPAKEGERKVMVELKVEDPQNGVRETTKAIITMSQTERLVEIFDEMVD